MSDPKTTTPEFRDLAPYRELTASAAILGIVIGIFMTAAFVFIALKLGFTLPGSTVAAILGFAMLKGVMRKGSIVENNINQTIASGVNNASSGVAFTLPALFILSLTMDSAKEFSPLPVLLSAVGGAFLGVVFIIPLRKQMIELERLRFPSGVAVASLLKSPGASRKQAVLLGVGFVCAAPFHVATGFGVLPEELVLNGLLGLPAYVPVAVGVSFASLGAGLLTGRGGLPFVFGGMLAWWIVAPVAVGLGWVPSLETVGLTASNHTYEEFLTWPVLYSQMLRPIGIGILIGGAISGVIAAFPAIRAAIRSLSAAAKLPGGGEELSTKVIGMGIVASLGVLFAAALLSSPDVSVMQAALIAVVGTVWLALAGLIVAQATGMTDISPISGMSIIGVTLMFFLTGGNVVAAVILGVAVSMGIGQCADMMADLKSGHLIGAIPKRQQIAQFAVSWIGAPVAIATIYLLWSQEGFGPQNPSLSAPQGAALAALIEGLQAGAAPLDKYVAGSAIGLGLGIFPISGLGVLVGLAMYLPFYITMTYGIGCFASMAIQRAKGAKWMGSHMVPLAAGFIIGEALTSLSVVLIKIGMEAMS